MPILVKTMRDLWDEKRPENKENPKKLDNVLRFPEEIQCHFRDYIARKRAFQDQRTEMAQIFSDYKDRLGEAGFLEIK